MPKYPIQFKASDYIDDILSPSKAKKVPLAKFPSMPYDDLVVQYAEQNDLDPDFVKAVIYEESKGKQSAFNKSSKAEGLMQLTPQTMKELAIEPGDAEQNIAGGTRYLADLLTKFDGNHEHALAAYHAGTTAFKNKGRKLEAMGKATKAYVPNVLKWYNEGIPESGWEKDKPSKQGQ